jgi:hypothetical protein
MVFGFIIASLDSLPLDPKQNTPIQIYLAQFFTPEGNDKNKYERQQYIAARVQSEFVFMYSCSTASAAMSELPDWGTYSLGIEPNMRYKRGVIF